MPQCDDASLRVASAIQIQAALRYLKEVRMKSTPQLNPDGVSVKGCKIICAPAGHAGGYSALATNPYRGCGHKCGYCYVPHIIRMDRREFNAGATPRPNFLRLLEKDARKCQALGITPRGIRH
jgi:hypothetical protein